MSDAVPTAADFAAGLREAFDRSFAVPHAAAAAAGENLLAIRLDAAAYALRLSEIAELAPARKVTPLFADVPALLGIAGFRGAIVPVYDVAALLGRPAAATVRWLALAAAEPVALAFAEFEGHRRVAPDAIVARAAGEDARDHVRHFARIDDAMLPIVHLPSVLAAIRRRAAVRRPAERG